MRRPRLKPRFPSKSSCYHCLSRVVDGRFALGDTEKDHLVRWIHAYATFCGLRVLTLCVMSNHFHLLLEVPTPPQQKPDATEVLRRFCAIAEAGEFDRTRSRLEFPSSAKAMRGRSRPASRDSTGACGTSAPT